MRVTSLKAVQVLVPIGVLLLACAFVVSPGVFNIDEFVQYAGARAFLETGSFIVPNGLPEFSSPDLNLWILVAGPHGLTPQYPLGVAFLGAPLLAMFGIRGLMLINVLAGIGTLFALWALAKKHFGGTAVALVSVLLLLCASFWPDYLFAIWPHSVSVLCTTLALMFTLDGLKAEPPGDLKAGLAAGVAIGAGLLFRTSAILTLPGIAFAAVLLARRPFRMMTFTGLGLAPFVILTSAANYVRFGTLNPLSYGKSGGNTDLSTYAAPIAALALVSLLLVASRFVKWRPRKPAYVIGLAAIALIIVLSPPLRDFAQRYIAGAWGLLVDATTIHDPRPGVHARPGGLLSFWGLWKKALGQSMPWLGLLFLAFHMPQDDELRRSQRVVLIVAAVRTLPFFMTEWHGGLGGNMRYLLALVPLLCALSARYLIDFARPMAHSTRILIWGAVSGAVIVTLWIVFLPTREGGAQQILSTWMLLTIVGLALLSGVRWAGQGTVRVVCLGAIGAGLAASYFYMANDVKQSQAVRALAKREVAASIGLPDRTLAYVPATFVQDWAFQPGHLLAMPVGPEKDFDDALIDHVLANHYRVLVSPLYATRALRARYGTRLAPSGVKVPSGELLEIRASSDQAPATTKAS